MSDQQDNPLTPEEEELLEKNREALAKSLDGLNNQQMIDALAGNIRLAIEEQFGKDGLMLPAIVGRLVMHLAGTYDLDREQILNFLMIAWATTVSKDNEALRESIVDSLGTDIDTASAGLLDKDKKDDGLLN